MSADYELSESHKRYTKKMSEYEELNTTQNDNESDIISPLKVADDIDNISKTSKSKSKSKSKKASKKAKSKSKSKSKSSRKIKSKPINEENTHSLNAFTKSSSQLQYQSLDERPFNPHMQHAQTNNCLTQTAPFNAGRSLQLNADLLDTEENIDPHQHHNPQPREDASNLAFPVNPFDHLMPHKDDFGTPNMAWIGDDGLVHTPQGGVYAKTTEAIANFRRELKYDGGWHRTRQRYICLILLIMFLTLCAVVVLLIARDVVIIEAELIYNEDIWNMDDCPTHKNISKGCNVTIAPLLNVKINNHNWVPATVNSWTVNHLFFCAASTLACPPGGSEFGTHRIINDGQSEINRKGVGSVLLNDTHRFRLYPCKLDPPNATYCEWEQSCIDSNSPGHFILELRVVVELSCALQSSTQVTTAVRLGTSCNGTAIVCQVGEEKKSDSKLCH